MMSFADRFLYIKNISEKLEMRNGISSQEWKCIFMFSTRPHFFKHTKVLSDFSWKGKYSMMEILLCHLTLKKKRYLYFMYAHMEYIFLVSSSWEFMRGWYFVYLPIPKLCAVLKCIFPQRSVFLLFSFASYHNFSDFSLSPSFPLSLPEFLPPFFLRLMMATTRKNLLARKHVNGAG